MYIIAIPQLEERLPQLHIHKFQKKFCSATAYPHIRNRSFPAVHTFKSATFKKCCSASAYPYIRNRNFIQQSATSSLQI
jgi:hypothetical protein